MSSKLETVPGSVLEFLGQEFAPVQITEEDFKPEVKQEPGPEVNRELADIIEVKPPTEEPSGEMRETETDLEIVQKAAVDSLLTCLTSNVAESSIKAEPCINNLPLVQFAPHGDALLKEEELKEEPES